LLNKKQQLQVLEDCSRLSKGLLHLLFWEWIVEHTSKKKNKELKASM